jgi:hypothetical protein
MGLAGKRGNGRNSPGGENSLPLYVAAFQFRYNKRRNADYLRNGDQGMRDRLIGLLCTALFGALTFFYVDQIWLSSDHPHQPANHGPRHTANTEAKYYNPFSAFWNWTTHEPVGFYTFVLSIFTGALVCISTVQIRYLIRADKIAAVTANAAKDAADASKRIIESTQRVERAYLFLWKEINRRQISNAAGGDTLEIQFAFQNQGKTPALLQQINVEMRVIDKCPTEFRQIASDMPPGLNLSSGEKTPFFPCRRLIQSEEWASIKQKKLLLLFLGSVKYHDVFGDLHETAFCLEWDASGFGPAPTDKLNYYN